MKTETPPERQAALEKLGALIKKVKFAMLTTLDEDGTTLRSRPMATQEVEFDGTLWFFTRASAPKVDEVAKDHQVNVAYAEPSEQTYVSVSGRASLVRDKAKAAELWKPTLKAWFPKGLEDPDLALLKVTVEKAEYWDMPGNVVVHAFGFVKATLTGQSYQPGENEKITLS